MKIHTPLFLATALLPSLGQAAGLSGFGELHLHSTTIDSTAKQAPSLDLHHFGLGFDHSFYGTKWSLNGEMEWDSMDSAQNSPLSSLKQVELSFYVCKGFILSGGLIPLQVGLNNKLKPEEYLMVERPDFYQSFIPGPWSSHGLKMKGELDMNSWGTLNYSSVLLTGLRTNQINASEGILGAVNSPLHSSTESLIYGGAVDYSSDYGFQVGTSYHLDQLTNNAQHNRRLNEMALWEYHAQYEDYGIRALYQSGQMDFSYNASMQGDLKQNKAWYTEIGYDVLSPFHFASELYPFFHYAENQKSTDTKNADSSQVWKSGLSFKTANHITLKGDYGIRKASGKAQQKELQFGLSYTF